MDAGVMRRRLAALLLACSCGGASSTAEGPAAAEPATTPTPAVPEPSAPTPARADAKALLAWLDPDAVAVAWLDLPAGLDVDAFATVFAMPPKSAKLLRDYVDVELALDAVLPADAPRPSTWLSREGFAMLPAIATGTYVVRRMLRPRAEIEALLLRTRMQATTHEGFTVLVPQGPLPLRVVLLGEDVIAFLPAREIGTGLGPLTAGRDLPPSETRRELERVLAESPVATIELYASGPLLHFDLGHDVAQFMLRARPWQGRGLDVQMRLLPLVDQGEDPLVTANADATALGKRELSLETEAVRAIAGKVGFSIDGAFVEGRLQLPAEDLQALGATP
ncbi:MAG: hypothetical protein K1X88_13355 [Nannocystaceae bacterium]|nr:hypothetical protein [Nannocystaceae bacterium]